MTKLNKVVASRDSLGRNLTHGMADLLGRRIVVGYFETVPFPTEAEIAKVHGVSRSVTREAVKMLTAKGLVTARPRQGTVVEPASSWNLFDPDVLRWLLDRKFSMDLLVQFTQLRLAVEPSASALAATAGEPEGLRQIDEGYARMVAAEAGEDDPLEADIAFHVAVLRASANPFFEQFRDVVGTALRTSIRFTNRIKGHSASLPAHAAVRDAIAAGDAVGARRAMETIVQDVLVLIEDAQLKL